MLEEHQLSSFIISMTRHNPRLLLQTNEWRNSLCS